MIFSTPRPKRKSDLPVNLDTKFFLGSKMHLFVSIIVFSSIAFADPLPYYDSIENDYNPSRIPVATKNQNPFLTAKLSTNMQSAVYGQNCKQSYFNEPVLFRAARCAETPATIRVLLHRPYYMNQLNEKSDFYHKTPLHVAAEMHPWGWGIIRELIYFGSDPLSCKDENSRTPFMMTAYNYHGAVEAYKALAQDFPKTNISKINLIQDENGWSIWHHISYNNNHKLAENILTKYSFGVSEAMEQTSNEFETPFQIATRYKSVEVMNLFKQHTDVRVTVRERLYMLTGFYYCIDVILGLLALICCVLVLAVFNYAKTSINAESTESLLSKKSGSS